jgi:gliding motility-associated-like protein
MNGIKKILFTILLFTGLFSQGQIIGPNLVRNSSFEDYDTCPLNFSELYKAKYWWGASADYYNSCSILMGVPSNFSGFQYAHSGNAYAGFALYLHQNLNPNNNYTYIESIKNKLEDSLKRNKRYCVDYFVTMSEYSFKYTSALNGLIIYDSIGAMFSINQVQNDMNPIICDTCVKSIKSVIGLDTLNWVRFSGSILANGGEKYLTIGKFNTMNWLPTISCLFYVYIDDVSVCECAYNINLGPDTTLCESESLILNASLPNATYTWQDSSNTATYEVKQPGTYWVRAYVAEYGITSSDTIFISPGDENYCTPSLTIPNFITPNGDGMNDNFQIGNADKYELNLKIFNRWGNLIYQNAHYQNDYNGNSCADGVYYYLLTAKSLRNGKEKQYKGSVTKFSDQ